jgi:hypothetical protein
MWEAENSSTSTSTFKLPSPPRYVFQDLPQIPIVDVNVERTENNINEEDLQCPYCNESLPSILSEKLQLKLQFLQTGTSIMESDRQEFCFMHRAESQIVPIGLLNGYPKSINFDQLPSRIHNLRLELLEIIRKNSSSYYRDFAFSVHNELGKKANLPMIYMNRFEIFQVIIIAIEFILLFLLNHNSYYSQDITGLKVYFILLMH